MKRMRTIAFVSACLGCALLIAGSGGVALAGSDPPPPSVDDCWAVWNNANISTCSRTAASFKNGICKFDSDCLSDPRYATNRYESPGPPHSGCWLVENVREGSRWRFVSRCPTSVSFSLDDAGDVNLRNCDAQLRADSGTSCQ